MDNYVKHSYLITQKEMQHIMLKKTYLRLSSYTNSKVVGFEISMSCVKK